LKSFKKIKKMTLGEITQSEFTLLGAISEDELLTALEGATPQAKRSFAKSVKAMASKTRMVAPSRGSRGELEKRIHMLPSEIQEGLAKQTLQAVDAAYYVVKDISGSKVQKLFKDDDNKVVSQSNLSSAKLEKGNMFMLSGLTLLAGVAADGESFGDVNFGVLPDYLRNGEFEFNANGTTLIQNASCELFNTTGQNIPVGHYVLDNPKLIKDQQTIEFNLEWATNAPVRSYIKAIMRGTIIIKA
jgi:hypothetical protein